MTHISLMLFIGVVLATYVSAAAVPQRNVKPVVHDIKKVNKPTTRFWNTAPGNGVQFSSSFSSFGSNDGTGCSGSSSSSASGTGSASATSSVTGNGNGCTSVGSSTSTSGGSSGGGGTGGSNSANTPTIPSFPSFSSPFSFPQWVTGSQNGPKHAFQNHFNTNFPRNPTTTASTNTPSGSPFNFGSFSPPTGFNFPSSFAFPTRVSRAKKGGAVMQTSEKWGMKWPRECTVWLSFFGSADKMKQVGCKPLK